MTKQNANQSPIVLIINFFSSIKLTVAVLLTIAATAVIGTVIPQNRPHEFYHILFSKMRFGEELFRLSDRLDLFNMYDSFWFQGLILILALNILVCSIDRLQTVWKIVFPRQLNYSVKTFKQSDTPPLVINAPAAQLKNIYHKTLSQMFRTTHLETTDDGFALFAEKGRLTRLGVYVVHFSILILLAGTLVGSFFGFDGYVNIPEGETVQEVFLRDAPDDSSGASSTIPLDFAIRCDDFNVRFYESGRPREYRSSLTLLDGDRELLSKDIVVNKPLRYQGINIFQSTYGLAAVKQVRMRFVSRESDLEYAHEMAVGDTVKIPEGLGRFTLTRFIESYMFKGVHDLGAAMVGVLEQDGASEVVFLPVRFEGFDKMRRDDVIVSVADYEQQYYTGLQVTKDPGVPLVYAGFLLMIVGIYITFFTSHQRFCVQAVEADGKTTVTVLSKANKNKPAARKKAETISERFSLLTA